MLKEWYKCPVCGQKLLMIDITREIGGVFTKCKKCKQEIEVRNEPKSEPTAV